MIFTNTKFKRAAKEMSAAANYRSWKKAALSHDELSGMNRWKKVEHTRLYDYASIRTRLNRLRKYKKNGSYHDLLFTLNEGIHGNMGGMGASSLYDRAKVGTKKLIVDYVNEICIALKLIDSVDDSIISREEKDDLFFRASHCFGCSALMLSGGAVLGNFHVGVIKTLLAEGLLPSVISGSSAGAIIAAMIGTNTDKELHKKFDSQHLIMTARQEAGWVKRLLNPHQKILIEDVQKFVERLIPDLTFLEAYELTGRKINISVAPAEFHQTSRLLNATTSPNVYVRSAVMASSAVPGIFPPVTLMAQNAHGEKQEYLPERKWVDGSVSDDLPAKRLARLYGVNHFIVSQTNPVVLPFLNSPLGKLPAGRWISSLATSTLRESLKATKGITKLHAQRWPRAGLLLNMYYSVAAQTYVGDINIIPDYSFVNPRKLLAIASEEEIMALIEAGEHATWPKVEMIRVSTQIGRTLDEILGKRR